MNQRADESQQWPIAVRTLATWDEIVEAADFLASFSYVFRGQEDAEWPLKNSIEREFGEGAGDVEVDLFFRFMRAAPRSLPPQAVPSDNDVAAWLGLIQHHGGPTRLLDVTRSFYVALFFAYETSGTTNRALWAIDYGWCLKECANIMAQAEGITFDQAVGRASGAQAQLVFSLVYKQPYRDPLFQSFRPFTGVFALDPWKPDPRQSAQQAMFLCAANVRLGFMANIAAHPKTPQVVHRFVLPASLRTEVIDRLAMMNVTAASLFPDLGGLARSLRTFPVRREREKNARPPWETRK